MKVAAPLVEVAAIGLAVVSGLALLGGAVWPLALFEHFRLQYVVLALLAAAVAGGLRRWRPLDVAAITASGNLLLVAPALRAEPLPVPADAATLRVLLLNVHTASRGHAAVRALIDELDADVVALVEVDQVWLDALAPALVDYPGRLEQARRDNFGIALYYRGALDGAVMPVGAERPSVVATLQHDGASVQLILTHPTPPMTSGARTASAASSTRSPRWRIAAVPTVVLGDLNATPWSRPFQRLLARGGLRASRAGFGVQASFPAGLAILRIPIDHVLVSAGIGVRERRIERDVGSDHLPVYVELAVSRPTWTIRPYLTGTALAQSRFDASIMSL